MNAGASRGELDGRRYLSKKMVEFMLSDHTVGMGGTTIATTGPGYGYGLGWAVRLQNGFAWVPGSKGDAMWARWSGHELLDRPEGGACRHPDVARPLDAYPFPNAL